MNHNEALEVLRPQWEGGLWAKSSGELLWEHQYAVWAVAKKLASFSHSITAEKLRLLELACLTHDIRKMDKKCQQRLHEGRGPGNHKLHKEDLEDYFRNRLHGQISVTDDDIQTIWDITRTHHSVSENDLSVQVSVDVDLFQMLRVSDWIASMAEPSFDTIERIQRALGRVFKLTYFNFSRFASPTSNIVVDTVVRAYREIGWQPIMLFPSGGVFVGDTNFPLPNGENLAEWIQREFVKATISLQAPVPVKYPTDFLTMLPKEFPELYLEAHEERIRNDLGLVDRRQLVFMKLALDLMKAKGIWNSKSAESAKVTAIVQSANSQGGTNAAKTAFTALYNEPAPASVNREFLDSLFDRAKVTDVVPSHVKTNLDRHSALSMLSADELFQLLEDIISSGPRTRHDNTLKAYFRSLLSLEEEIDFTETAKQVFEKYKVYKITSDANKGVCERCCSPLASPMQRDGMNLRESGQSFSQIKPKGTVNRAICPLCVYDNFVVRNESKKDSSFVYARVETPIVDLISNVEPLRHLVAKVEAGLRYPRQLARLEEIRGCENLPFPRGLPIPVQDTLDDREPVASIRLNDCGVLLRIAMVDSNRGPKDLRCQYEPVYHVLKFLGYQVSIGTEDRVGFFGQRTESTPGNYRRSLAVILLASQLSEQKLKNTNQFIYASELLSKSPSTTLTYAAGDGRDRFGMRKSLLPVFLEFLIKDEVYVTSRRGGLTMTSLLQDAAFLTPVLVEREKTSDDQSGDKTFLARDGAMWTLCNDVGRVKSRFRRDSEITKHSATKPISQALDQLMLGRGIDFALNKFMQHLSTEAYIDTDVVTEFVKGVRQILENAEKLRKNDVTNFLRYKNGLLSAVFMFTRYPDLKAVLDPEKGA